MKKTHRKRLGFISIFQGRMIQKVDPVTGEIELEYQSKDLSHTIEEQIRAQLNGEPPPLEVLTGDDILKEIKE